MCEIGEYIERLEGKIERQREQLSRLRAKKNRCLLGRADTYRRAIQRQKELELLCLSMKSDIKSLSEDNEHLRAEIVRLSGGEKSSERVGVQKTQEQEKFLPCKECGWAGDVHIKTVSTMFKWDVKVIECWGCGFIEVLKLPKCATIDAITKASMEVWNKRP